MTWPERIEVKDSLENIVGKHGGTSFEMLAPTWVWRHRRTPIGWSAYCAHVSGPTPSPKCYSLVNMTN
jgi:hypothetical protein